MCVRGLGGGEKGRRTTSCTTGGRLLHALCPMKMLPLFYGARHGMKGDVALEREFEVCFAFSNVHFRRAVVVFPTGNNSNPETVGRSRFHVFSA